MKIKVKKDNSKKVLASLKAFSDKKLVVGVVNPTIAGYGTYNEFGTDKIPQRSFLRSTYDEQINKWRRFIETTIKSILKLDVAAPVKEWDKLGHLAVGKVRQKLSSNIPPPNAPATVKKKGEGKTTLFDTGALLKAITYEVRRR